MKYIFTLFYGLSLINSSAQLRYNGTGPVIINQGRHPYNPYAFVPLRFDSIRIYDTFQNGESRTDYKVLKRDSYSCLEIYKYAYSSIYDTFYYTYDSSMNLISVVGPRYSEKWERSYYNDHTIVSFTRKTAKKYREKYHSTNNYQRSFMKLFHSKPNTIDSIHYYNINSELHSRECFTYDSLGRLTSGIDYNLQYYYEAYASKSKWIVSEKRTYIYNSNNQISEILIDRRKKRKKKVKFTYSETGSLLQIKDHDRGRKAWFNYNGSGHLEELVIGLGRSRYKYIVVEG